MWVWYGCFARTLIRTTFKVLHWRVSVGLRVIELAILGLRDLGVALQGWSFSLRLDLMKLGGSLCG